MIACITYWMEYGDYRVDVPGRLQGFFSGVSFGSLQEAKDEVVRIIRNQIGKVPVTFVYETTKEVAS